MATTTKRKPTRERDNPEPETTPRRRTSRAAVMTEEEEDRQDVEDARKSRAEAERKGYIPFERVIRELGF
jgi:nucleotide-binding universal stress UspA family protein